VSTLFAWTGLDQNFPPYISVVTDQARMRITIHIRERSTGDRTGRGASIELPIPEALALSYALQRSL
jgi:hypothetical protein